MTPKRAGRIKTRSTARTTARPAAAQHDVDEIELVHWFDVDELVPWPDLNPRQHFDKEALGELAASIKVDGIREPILVHDTGKAPYWIVAGERRFRAARIAGARVPALVKEYSHAEALRVSVIENLQRSDLTAVEEARGFARLLELEKGLTQAKLAAQLGRSQPYVANRIRLLELPDAVIALIEEGVLDIGAARDVFLPFAKIPEAKLAKLTAAAVKEIRSFASRYTLQANNVHQIVGSAATSLSHSLSPNAYNDAAPLFDVALHEKCTCGGPKFNYTFSADRRCFDDDWWNAAQAKAKTAIEERRQKSMAKALTKAKDVNGQPALTDQAFSKQFKHGEYRTIATGQRIDELVDPTLLPAASLVLVQARGGISQLQCVDLAAFRKAKGAVEKERKELLDAHREVRVAHEKAELAHVPLEPWMLREFMADPPYRERLIDIGHEHGLELGKRHDVEEHVRALSDDDAVLFFKVVALRARNGTDSIEDQVEQELKAKYAPLLEAILPPAPVRPGLTAEENTEADRLIAELDGATSDDNNERLKKALDAWSTFAAGHKGIEITDDDGNIIQDAEFALEEVKSFDDEADTADDLEDEEVVV